MPTLSWLNREQAVRAATRAPFRLLDHEPLLSHGDPDNENMLIRGDNLESAKALLPYFAGRVKCFAIDPPYNTKSAFEHYDDNLEHSTWLSLMYPRLELMRELLAEDGSVWVCIDDNEAHYLKVMMDEVFGRKNFVANVVWQKKYAVKSDSEFLSESHDHIFLYAKNRETLSLNRLPRTSIQDERYKNPDGDPRGPWTSGPLQRNEARDYAIYPITTPSGKQYMPPKGTSWRYTKEKLDELIADNRIWFGRSGGNVPRLKRFLCEVADSVPVITWWSYQDSGHNDEARRESKSIHDTDDVFGTPKPERLIQRILTIATNPGDLVCDLFLGSGTTAAVAHKMGRRWIGVEMGDHAETHCVPRLKKVVDGEQGGISEAVGWKGGGGFRFYRLGPTITDELGNINSAIRFNSLAAHVWFAETHMPFKAKKKSPLLGVHKGTAIYLLYNGILGDTKSNTLTGRVLRDLPPHDGPKVVFSECTSLGDDRLKRENIIFKHIPYDIKGR